MDNLKDKTLKGVMWNLTERVGSRVIAFVPTLLLARLLDPEQFGLVAMLSLFMAVANVLLDSGFGIALIQKRDATYADECSIFYFNILVGGIVYLILFGLAPFIAGFFDQPILTPLTRWLTLCVPVQSFSLIQLTLLARALDFKTQVKANLAATLLAAFLGVAAAFGGLGVWSLVIQSVSNTLCSTLILWWLSAWRPAFIFSLSSLKGMFGFGSRLLLTNLVATFFDHIYQVFIGKVFSAVSLGYYMRASSVRVLANDTISFTLGRVLFPALASIKDDLARLQRGYRKFILLATFVHFPVMCGLVVMAKPLFTLLFSEKWLEAVPLFQLMCLAALLVPLQMINLDVLKVKGRSDLVLRLEIIKRFLLVASILVSYRWGIQAMLVGQVVLSVIWYYLNSYYSGILIEYPMRSQMLDILPSFLFSGLMGGAMFAAGYMLQSTHPLIQVVVLAAVGAGAYLSLQTMIKSEALAEIVQMFKQFVVPRLAT
jgi:O-antigen/teichoic acid export membrane protein